MNTKVWFKSTTVWFNVILALITFIQTLGTIVPISPEILANIAIVGNLLLRIKTTTGLSTTSN